MIFLHFNSKNRMKAYIGKGIGSGTVVGTFQQQGTWVNISQSEINSDRSSVSAGSSCVTNCNLYFFSILSLYNFIPLFVFLIIDSTKKRGACCVKQAPLFIL